LKYKIIEHAERNAIYAAAQLGESTRDGIMIAPWAACSDCARGIIQSGVSTLVRHLQASQRSPDFWLEEIQVADQMLKEAGVKVIDLDWHWGEHIEVRHSGEVWVP
jgi:dCMP deaminase